MNCVRNREVLLYTLISLARGHARLLPANGVHLEAKIIGFVEEIAAYVSLNSDPVETRTRL